MKIITRQDERKVYSVIKSTDRVFLLVRILNMYKTQDEASDKLNDLLDGIEKDEDLIQEFTKSDW